MSNLNISASIKTFTYACNSYFCTPVYYPCQIKVTYLTAVTSIMTIITIASVPQTYIRALPILNFRMAFTETSKLKYAVLYRVIHTISD